VIRDITTNQKRAICGALFLERNMRQITYFVFIIPGQFNVGDELEIGRITCVYPADTGIFGIQSWYAMAEKEIQEPCDHELWSNPLDNGLEICCHKCDLVVSDSEILQIVKGHFTQFYHNPDKSPKLSAFTPPPPSV